MCSNKLLYQIRMYPSSLNQQIVFFMFYGRHVMLTCCSIYEPKIYVRDAPLCAHLDKMALTYSCLPLGPLVLLLTAFTEGQWRTEGGDLGCSNPPPEIRKISVKSSVAWTRRTGVSISLCSSLCSHTVVIYQIKVSFNTNCLAVAYLVLEFKPTPTSRKFDKVKPDCKLSGKCLVFLFQHPN